MEKCFRCSRGSLADTTPDDVDGISFYECSQCKSKYAKRPGRQLCDRWGMPITVALYGLICHNNTDDQFDYIVGQMQRKGRGFVDKLIIHIAIEINHPKQYVSDVHNFVYLDEVALREFLIKLSEKLQQWRDGNK